MLVESDSTTSSTNKNLFSAAILAEEGAKVKKAHTRRSHRSFDLVGQDYLTLLVLEPDTKILRLLGTTGAGRWLLSEVPFLIK